MTDIDAEDSETLTWLAFAFACNYISREIFEIYSKENEEVGKLINYMIQNPHKFGLKQI